MSYATAARFGVYSPAAFGWAARDPWQDSSLLVPFSHSGVEFVGKVNRDVVGLFTCVLDELVPLIPGGLMTPGCWGYSTTSVTVGGDRSFHTYGIAIDVNAPANPMYARERPTGLHALPPEASAIARKWGCEWGGDWSYPQDWMHLECHLTPEVARSITPGRHAPASTVPTPITPSEEDDMKVQTVISTHPTTGKQRGFLLGRKTTECTPDEARAVAALYGDTPRQVSEVLIARGRPVLDKVI